MKIRRDRGGRSTGAAVQGRLDGIRDAFTTERVRRGLLNARRRVGLTKAGQLALLAAVVTWIVARIIAGTPLVGLTFSLPGDGRIGFVVLGILAALASLATPR